MAPLSLKIIMDEGVVTRTVKFQTDTKVADASAIIKDKIYTADDGKEYALFLPSADDDRSGVWLEPHRSLEYYMLRDGDSLLYRTKLRNLRIRMLDGSLKTLQVDDSKNIGNLMISICGRIGITNHDEYGLCHEEEEENDELKVKENKLVTGTLTLKRKAQPRERDAKMEMLSKKLKTDDNVEWLDQHRTLREQGVDPTVTVLLKRRLFFSDRNIDSRDPVQLNLLYVQTRDAILNGRHPVTENQSHECKTRWVHMRDVFRRILRKSLNSPGKPAQLYKYHNELAFVRPFFRDLFVKGKRQEFDSDDHDNGMHNDEVEKAESTDQETAVDSDESVKPDQELVVIKTRPTHLKLISVTEDQTPNRILCRDIPPTSIFEPNDQVDSFLLSIGATLKRLTPYHLNLAKSKIFSIVQDHELQMIVENPLNT